MTPTVSHVVEATPPVASVTVGCMIPSISNKTARCVVVTLNVTTDWVIAPLVGAVIVGRSVGAACGVTGFDGADGGP